MEKEFERTRLIAQIAADILSRRMSKPLTQEFRAYNEDDAKHAVFLAKCIVESAER